MTTDLTNTGSQMPDEGNARKVVRGALQVAGGAVPIVGGMLSAIAVAWSE